MIFILPIEVKIREFLSKIFFAYKLLENGHKVIIGPQRDIPQNISNIKTVIGLIKLHINKINKQSMQYKNFNYRYVDEEGPVAFLIISPKTRYPKG